MPEKERTIEEITVKTIEAMHADMIGTKYKLLNEVFVKAVLATHFILVIADIVIAAVALDQAQQLHRAVFAALDKAFDIAPRPIQGDC